MIHVASPMLHTPLIEPPHKPMKIMKLPPEALRLAYCIAGVVSSLVVYGVLQVRLDGLVLACSSAAVWDSAICPQERIMTIPFGEGDKKEIFKYSLFLVCCNRLVAAVIAGSTLLVRAVMWIVRLGGALCDPC